MAILNGSPAADAADSGTSLSTDQRGVARPQASGFDIGAYEAGPPNFALSTARTISVDINGTLSATVTMNSLEYFNSPVTLAVSALPSGVSASFSPNPVTPPYNGSVSSALKINLARLGNPADLDIDGKRCRRWDQPFGSGEHNRSSDHRRRHERSLQHSGCGLLQQSCHRARTYRRTQSCSEPCRRWAHPARPRHLFRHDHRNRCP